MPQGSRVRSIAETDLHEALTLVGFVLCSTALMAVFLSTAPFLPNNWSSVWPFALATALVAALLIVGGLFVWARLPAPVSEYRSG